MPNSHTMLPKILCVSLPDVNHFSVLFPPNISIFFAAKRRKEQSIETPISIPRAGKEPLSRKHSLVLTTKQYEDDKHRKNAFKHAWDRGKPLLKYPVCLRIDIGCRYPDLVAGVRVPESFTAQKPAPCVRSSLAFPRQRTMEMFHSFTLLSSVHGFIYILVLSHARKGLMKRTVWKRGAGGSTFFQPFFQVQKQRWKHRSGLCFPL